MKKIFLFLVIIGTIFSLGVTTFVKPVAAVDIYNGCASGSSSELCKHKNDDIKTYLKNGINILLYVLGAIAVIMIIISGILYTTSGGNSGTVTKAKDTLLYSVVGLVVAIFAYAIVNFVILNF